MTYYMSLDGGANGEDTVEADSLREAMVAAMEWAAGGDWSFAQADTEETYGGCGEVSVRVWSDDAELEGTYTIPTLGDLQDAEIEEDGDVLAERSGEYSTERIVRVGAEYYYQHANGGDSGAWNRQDGDGVWRDSPVEPTREITRSEARAMLLDWDEEPAEVARLTTD